MSRFGGLHSHHLKGEAVPVGDDISPFLLYFTLVDVKEKMDMYLKNKNIPFIP